MYRLSIKILCLSVLSVGLVGTAQAREFADIYTDCGIGAMIAPNNDAVAAVTNVTWDLGTTAISSNASSPETCQGGEAESAQYIYDAYPSIAKDLAKGEGEHLAALLEFANVGAEKQEAVTLRLRSQLAKLASATDYDSQSRFVKAEALYNALQVELAS